MRRRDVLALGAAGTLALGLGPASWRAARAATPKTGGRFRIGIGEGSTSDSLDPATFSNTFIQFIGRGIHNCLTEVSNEGRLIGELAESWEASDDAVTWTFELRRDVVLHNGKTMTAEDVVASINHHRGEESKSAAKSLVDPIADIEVDDERTVFFTLQQGNADFPFVIGDYHLAILPSEDGKVDWQFGHGTGGYVLQSLEPGVRATLKRNPDYMKPRISKLPR